MIGGGPAGTWAAIKAAQAGADAAFADKGYTDASGAIASVGTGIGYVDDVPDAAASCRPPTLSTNTLIPSGAALAGRAAAGPLW
ncbi:hypothetical protein ACGFXB_44040 [Streptomyces canus]|uniref:hypothetical protein n=1 Tax=Streptomyces canus TaxID=58343 RepID=UPI00371FAD5E